MSGTSAAISAITVKDSNNNSYTQSPNSPSTFLSGSGQVWLFYLVAPSNATNSITVSWTGTGGGIWIDDFTVSGGSAVFDADLGGETAVGTTPVNTPSLTPAGTGELLYSGMTAGGSLTAPAAGATLGNWTGATGGLQLNNGAEYDLSSVSGANPVDYTQSGGPGWSGMVMAFKLSSGAPSVAVDFCPGAGGMAIPQPVSVAW
jgi:hypothetical protein